MLLAASLIGAGCGEDSDDSSAPTPTETPVTEAAGPETTLPPEKYDIVGTALNARAFTILASLVVDAGLVGALKGEGPLTVFAPVDAAFEALPEGTVAAVRSDPDLLATVLTYHVVPGALKLADLEDGQKLTTLAGIDLEVTKDGDTTLINGIEVAAGDVEATNGIVHVMSGVLVPPS